MIYLDYAKATPNGYILNFFADSEADIADISNGKRFVTKNGTDYGIPLPSSTVVITMPDKAKKTYVLNGDGEWLEGGVEMDYSKLENAPITLANLTEEGFEPEVNTYYEHLGETTEDFIKGIIYLYDGKEYKAIDGSGSGTGVQADYNQNDSTADDYIKNRPFYESPAVVFDENITTVQPEGAQFYFWETTNKVINANVGDEIKIIFNGVEYTQTVKDYFGGAAYVGNFSILGQGEDTKEPFFILLNLALLSSKEEVVRGVSVSTKAAYNGEVKIITNDIKTIDPKFIKDMYYETTTETQLFDGVVDINTEKQSSGETYYTGTLSPSFTFGVSGDKCEVSINGTSYTLDVITLGTLSVAGKQDFSNGIPVYLETNSDGVTTIGSKTSYTGATLVIKNIHTDIIQIPAKYVPQGGEVVEITVTETTDAAIQKALETHLKENTDIAKRISESSSFTLKVKQNDIDGSYRFTANKISPTVAAFVGSWFTSIAVEDDFWSNNRSLKNTIVRIKSDGSVKFITSLIYDNNLFFGIPDTEGMQQDESELAKLGFYKRGEVALSAVSNTILLHEWVKYAQQRADFAIPTPTKETDLVDKKYVDGKASGVVSKTSIKLNLSEFTYDETAQKFTLSQSAANTVSQIIQKQFELRGFCVAFLTVGETAFASYQINFSNITTTTTAYLSFSNPLYDSEDLSSNFNVLIKPETTAQRICSDTSLFNMFVKNQGVLEFVLYSM